MALINCMECNKEISDKSEKCIHCGYPISEIEKNTTETFDQSTINDKLKELNYKKFNFTNYNKIIENEENLKKAQKHEKKESLKGLIISPIAFILCIILANTFDKSHNDFMTGLLSLGALASLLFIFAYFYSFILSFTKYRAKKLLTSAVLHHYDNGLPLRKNLENNVEYKEIDFIEGDDRENFIKAAYNKQADAIINVNKSTRTISSTSTSGFGRNKTISTSHKDVEDWTGTAVKFLNISDEYMCDSIDILEIIKNKSSKF